MWACVSFVRWCSRSQTAQHTNIIQKYEILKLAYQKYLQLSLRFEWRPFRWQQIRKEKLMIKYAVGWVANIIFSSEIYVVAPTVIFQSYTSIMHKICVYHACFTIVSVSYFSNVFVFDVVAAALFPGFLSFSLLHKLFIINSFTCESSFFPFMLVSREKGWRGEWNRVSERVFPALSNTHPITSKIILNLPAFVYPTNFIRHECWITRWMHLVWTYNKDDKVSLKNQFSGGKRV